MFRRLFIVLAGFGATFYPNLAQAEFKVCNQTLNLYNVAIGIEKPNLAIGHDNKPIFYTEGWWTVPANACVSLVKEDLISRYVYLYATNIYGDDSLSGGRKLCIGSKKFLIAHPPPEALWKCWERGYQKVGFKEVDTGSASSWTIFIRENQN